MDDQSLNYQQQNLPNSTGALVLGILSIVFCCCYGVIGIILGIISLVLANQASNLYIASPESYTESSYKNMKGGKICAIIGLSLSCLYLVYTIFMLVFALNGEMEGIIEDLIREFGH